MKSLLATPIVVFLFAPAQAADPGTTAANFLNVGIGPRAIAMGEAQVGLADDVYATYWNPAGLAQLETPEAGFTHNEYFQGISQQFAAYAHPTTKRGTFAGSFSFLNIGKFDGYDAAGQPNGQVGASDSALALSYALPLLRDRRMESDLSIGFTGKWIQERLDTVTASAYAMDSGLLFAPGKKWGKTFEGLKLGLAARNLGTSMKFDEESFTLPRSLTAGMSWTGIWLGEAITLAVDGQQPNDGPRTVGVGVELTTLQMLIVRGGYTTRGDVGNGLRAGAGLRFKTLQLDYAFAGLGVLGNAHRIGLTFRFGRQPVNPLSLAENSYEKGLRHFQQERFTEALVDFNKALEIDPSHPQALEMMKKTYEKLKTIASE